MIADPKGMACPIDGNQLVMSERQGIEIDYCPTCRGVWLDRGELDKIVDRSANDAAAPVAQAAARATWPEQHGSGQYRHKRRKSFLEELFD
jgi:hypothetical protein